MILKAELTAKNKFAATVAHAAPLLRYRFGVSHWRLKTKNRHEFRKTPRV